MFYIFLSIVKILDAELLAVFEAAGLQNQAPCPTTHTSTESVYASAVASLWLVSSFWHINFLDYLILHRDTSHGLVYSAIS